MADRREVVFGPNHGAAVIGHRNIEIAQSIHATIDAVVDLDVFDLKIGAEIDLPPRLVIAIPMFVAANKG